MTARSSLRFGRWAVIVIAFSFGLSAQTPSGNPNISPLSAEMRAAMTGKSWKPECPVPLDDLMAVHVTYLGFDGGTHPGTLVVHKRFAAEAAQIFDELYKVRFPINKIDPWEN